MIGVSFDCLSVFFSYKLRVEGLLIKEEFNASLDYIRPLIDSVIEAAKGTHLMFYYS